MGVLGQASIENSVRNLIADLVWLVREMGGTSLGDRIGQFSHVERPWTMKWLQQKKGGCGDAGGWVEDHLGVLQTQTPK